VLTDGESIDWLIKALEANKPLLPFGFHLHHSACIIICGQAKSEGIQCGATTCSRRRRF
jgi:hypothetical protein